MSITHSIRQTILAMRNAGLACMCAGAALLISGCVPSVASQPFNNAAAPIAKPQRIVSLNLCTDQLLLQLVEPQRIQGLTNLSHDAAMSALHAQAVQHRTVQGGAEEVLLEKPDLVLVGQYTTRYTAQMLRQLGVRVVEVPLAQSLAEIEGSIHAVAEAVGEPQRGQALVADLRQQTQQLRDKQHGDAAQWPIAAERSWHGYSAGSGTVVDELIHLAGYRNAGAEAGLQGYGYLPLERLVATQPDLVLTPDYARDAPSVQPRQQLHPALSGTRLNEMMMPTRWTICGGTWTLQVAQQLADHKQQAAHP